jgi:DNA polymerase (family X)
VLDRAVIVARLREIASLLELHGGNRYKVRAFERGARALEASREPIVALVEEERLTALPGIGSALASQITELVRTGRSELLESLRAGLPRGVLELSQVGGIGLHVLRELHDTLGIATIDDLRRAAEEGRLQGVKGFGAKKEARILEAISRYESRAPAVPLAEGQKLADALIGEISELDGVREAYLAGSLRRSVELAVDVDLVVSAARPAAVARAIAGLPRVASIEQRGASSLRLRLADGTRIDVAVVLPPSLPTAMVHATGSPAHHERLKRLAEDRGLRLDARSLVDVRTGERLRLEDEADVYHALGISLVPPELREDQGEIEAALRGDPFDLVEVDDLRGFVHCHTTWSDGRGSIEEMARAAEARGASFLTITDHSKAAHYAGGLDLDRLRRQWDEIDEVQDRVGIRLLKGTEADILADGALDWPDRVLESLDLVIASVHNRHHQDEAKMTERVLRAMRHPIFKIWGHPLGRLVTSRPPIPLRVEAVLDALAESRGAIEINGDPRRLDLEPRWSRLARERGIPFVLSVDAHSVRDLDNARYAAGMARRAGVRRAEVLNARPLAAFARAVRPAPGRRAA